MGLASLAKTLFSRKEVVDQKQLRKARPLRNTFVQTTKGADGVLVLSAPLSQQNSGLLSWVAKKAKQDVSKQFELEPIGAFIWERCDGKQSFEMIAKALVSEYKMNRVEAEASLGAFLQMLSQRRLITMTVKSN
jgi:hypothetical protein